MNFKTTIGLLICVVAVAAILFLTRENSEPKPAPLAEPTKLIDLNSDVVTKITITGSDQSQLVLERSGNDWKITAPFQARGDAFPVNNLIRAILNMESGTQLGADSVSASTGLNPPNYTVEVVSTDGKSSRALIGNRSSTGGTVYVLKEGDKQPYLVGDDVLSELEKPAADFRDHRMVDIQSAQLTGIRITRGEQILELHKPQTDWMVTAPATMPADASEVSALIASLTSLRAEKFVDSSDLPKYQLDKPVATIALMHTAPSTQPTTQPGIQTSTTTLALGRYQDIAKKNVFASVDGTVATVPASVMEKISKTALDLRDRKVLTVQPSDVKSITIVEGPKSTTVQRIATEAAPIGPMPATVPATMPTTAATMPSTQPQRIWELAGAVDTNLDDAKVDQLLNSFNPLRATRFVKEDAATQPTVRFQVTLVSKDAATYALEITSGSGQTIGRYQDLTFELPSTIVNTLKTNLEKTENGDQTPGAEIDPHP